MPTTLVFKKAVLFFVNRDSTVDVCTQIFQKIQPSECICNKHFLLGIFYLNLLFQQSPRGDIDNGFVAKSCLSPPSPPVLAPQPKLRRMSSSTLSLSSRTKKKILTVRFMMICKCFNYRNMDFILLYVSIFVFNLALCRQHVIRKAI